MRNRGIGILLVFFLISCSAPTPPAVVALGPPGVVLLRGGEKGESISWSDIEGMRIGSHLVSEEEAAPVLVVLTKAGEKEVCSAYPRRVDPKSYAGLHNAISVDKESFLALRDGIVAGAGLKPDPETEGLWTSGGTANPLKEERRFPHGYAAN